MPPQLLSWRCRNLPFSQVREEGRRGGISYIRQEGRSAPPSVLGRRALCSFLCCVVDLSLSNLLLGHFSVVPLYTLVEKTCMLGTYSLPSPKPSLLPTFLPMGHHAFRHLPARAQQTWHACCGTSLACDIMYPVSYWNPWAALYFSHATEQAPSAWHSFLPLQLLLLPLPWLTLSSCLYKLVHGKNCLPPQMPFSARAFDKHLAGRLTFLALLFLTPATCSLTVPPTFTGRCAWEWEAFCASSFPALLTWLELRQAGGLDPKINCSGKNFLPLWVLPGMCCCKHGFQHCP